MGNLKMDYNGFEPEQKSGISGEQVFDAVVVGAGFAGVHMLNKLRKEGFSVRVFESGSDFGGVWYWNCYPGARVDIEYRGYQFSQEELWKDFQWTERFPSAKELRKYFWHVNKKLGLSRDVQFNTRVTAARFNNSRNQWLVETDTSGSVWASHLILCTGVASKRYTPQFPGLENFKGSWYHTSRWPQDGVDLNGKRVAVIGTGASGVQVIQEVGPIVSHLTVYQRTPNIALPMHQCSAANNEKRIKPGQSQLQAFAKMLNHFNGGIMDRPEKMAMEVSPEERRAHYEHLYQLGGLSFLEGNYLDIPVCKEANDTAYQFWCEKTRARIKDPVKRNLLAPKVAPHPLGAKRPSVEQNYYEVFNQNNVDLIDLNQSPIVRITKNGVETELEGEIPVDVLILATGFDSATGGILDIEIMNGEGESLRRKWNQGLATQLGVACAGFPNMFFLYGPQGSTGFAVGPVCIEVQGGWITDLLVKMKKDGNTRVEAKKEAEERWVEQVRFFWNSTLFCGTKSFYQGCNIPGKRIEPLFYLGGIPKYIQEFEDCRDKGYEGFTFNSTESGSGDDQN